MANGQGYMRQRANGSWTITVFLGKDANGKSRQAVKTVRGTKKEAQAEMASMIGDRNRGIDLKPERLTVAELAARWFESRRPDLAPSTAMSYEGLLRIHVLPVIGKVRLRDLKPLHIEAVKAGIVANGGSQKLALNAFRVLNALLKQAVRWQLIQHNPCDAIQAPRPRRFVPHTPTPDELERLFAVADATPYGALARLAVLTGARQGELLSLRWRHVDWVEQRITLPGTKTRQSARVVDLGPAAIELLRQQRTAEREKRLKLGPGGVCGSDEATVFTNLVGKPMDASGLKRTWRRIIRDAGVGHIRFHDLRHASATYLLQAGVPVQVVSERLGHTRTSTTTDIYAHVLPGMGREAAEALEKHMVSRWSNAQEG
jgi:integrase